MEALPEIQEDEPTDTVPWQPSQLQRIDYIQRQQFSIAIVRRGNPYLSTVPAATIAKRRARSAAAKQARKQNRAR